MNYVLSESTAQWLRAKMAQDRGYKPAAPLPPRERRRDTSMTTGAPKFIFSWRNAIDAESGENVASIGEGAVQVDGLTYLLPGGDVADMGDGTRYVCVRVVVENGAATGTYEAYGSIEELQDAQEEAGGEPGDAEAAGARTLILPLYRVSDYKVDLDLRPLISVDPNGVTSLNEMAGDLLVEADEEGYEIDGKTLYAKVTTESEDGRILVGLTDEAPGGGGEQGDGYCNDISGGWNGGKNDISGGGGNEISASGFTEIGNEISKWPCKQEVEN